jgi:nucleoside-diphosphate-sugar epimerase
VKYLITGGAGFIGSHLVDTLVARGERVVILDDLSTGRRSNIEHLLESDQVEFVEGSILDEDLVGDCVESVDAVFHLASAVGVQLIVNRPLDTLQRNVRGADIVISAATTRQKRLLFASTSEIYGKNSIGALDEEADRLLGAPTKSRWAYATAKVYGEQLAYASHRELGAETTVVRLFNTVGPRQTGRYGMVLPRFVRQALAGDDLTVYGTGTQSRCFAHVSDSVHAISLLMDADAAVGTVFNVGSDVEISIIELAGKVLAHVGSSSRIALVPYEEAYEEGFEELGRRQPDCTKLRELTGWAPSRTIDEAIDDTVTFEQSTAAAVESMALD